MARTRTTLIALSLFVGMHGVLLAQVPDKTAAPTTAPAPAKPKTKAPTQAQLQKQAKITLAAATATAQAAVPTGTIKGHELEREDGKLIYSFDIKIAGKSGTEEVNIDAMTGELIAKTHESPEDEAKEAAADKKAATKTAPAKKAGGS